MQRPSPIRRARGYTLVEVTAVTAIVGVLAGLAVPSFQAPLLKARRSDGIHALLQLQLSQEQWRSNHVRYASLDDLRLPAASSMRHYTLAVSDAAADGYTLTATASGAQAADRGCRVLRLTVARGEATRTSGDDAHARNGDADNRRCWGL